MTENLESIERQIADARSNLGRQLSEAEDKARQAIDWKTHYKRNPVALLAGAAAAGFVLSNLISESGGESRGDGSPRTLSMDTSLAKSALENMMEAFVAAASVKASEYIEQWLPGFHQEFSRRQA